MQEPPEKDVGNEEGESEVEDPIEPVVQPIRRGRTLVSGTTIC